ncbi:hypothetical protein Tco_0973544 [Tanacetum coccineum]
MGISSCDCLEEDLIECEGYWVRASGSSRGWTPEFSKEEEEDELSVEITMIARLNDLSNNGIESVTWRRTINSESVNKNQNQSDYGHSKTLESAANGGSILNLMEEVVKVGQTMGYNMDGCIKDITEIIESQGEFGDYFVIVRGVWLKSGIDLMIVVVYAPQEAKEKLGIFNGQDPKSNKLLGDKLYNGEDGNLNKDVSGGVRTCWTSIVHEVKVLLGSDNYCCRFTHPIEAGEWRTTRFWGADNWYEGGVIKELFLRMFALELNKNAIVSSKLNASSFDNSYSKKTRSGIEKNAT